MTWAATWGASALRLTYDGIAALDDVSVTATAGQVTAVVGGDGAGKTSLLRCLAGGLRNDALQRPQRHNGAACAATSRLTGGQIGFVAMLPGEDRRGRPESGGGDSRRSMSALISIVTLLGVPFLRPPLFFRPF